MKFYSRFSKLIVLMMVFMPISLTHAITMALEIHELVDESDIAVIGTVTGSQLVSNNVSSQNILNRRLGTLYSIHVDKVLYGKGAVKQAIFALSDVNAINSDLDELCKRAPVQIFAFQSRPLKFPDGATYYKNRSQLFFLKTSGFPASLPATGVIVSRSPLQRLTKSSLTEKYYFEACFGVRQSTWDLAQKQQKTELPTVEAFCKVMSITDLAKRKSELQKLISDKDALLARNARSALKKAPIEPNRVKRRKRGSPDQPWIYPGWGGIHDHIQHQ